MLSLALSLSLVLCSGISVKTLPAPSSSSLALHLKDWPSGFKVRVVNGGVGGVVVADRPGPSGQPHTLRVDPPVHHLRLQGKLKL